MILGSFLGGVAAAIAVVFICMCYTAFFMFEEDRELEKHWH